MKFLVANRIAPDGTPRSAVSHLGLYCLPMSHKKDAGHLNEKFFEWGIFHEHSPMNPSSFQTQVLFMAFKWLFVTCVLSYKQVSQ